MVRRRRSSIQAKRWVVGAGRVGCPASKAVHPTRSAHLLPLMPLQSWLRAWRLLCVVVVGVAILAALLRPSIHPSCRRGRHTSKSSFCSTHKERDALKAHAPRSCDAHFGPQSQAPCLCDGILVCVGSPYVNGEEHKERPGWGGFCLPPCLCHFVSEDSTLPYHPGITDPPLGRWLHTSHLPRPTMTLCRHRHLVRHSALALVLRRCPMHCTLTPCCLLKSNAA